MVVCSYSSWLSVATAHGYLTVFVFPPCLQSDKIVLTGPARNCEEAERALERKVQQLEAEKEERVSVRERGKTYRIKTAIDYLSLNV